MMIPGSAGRWLRPMMNCIDRGQSHEKPKGPTAIRKATLALRLFFFFFFLSLAAVGSGGVRARAKPAEFPLLRKVPLTSAVSEILKFQKLGRRALYCSLRGFGRTGSNGMVLVNCKVIGVREKAGARVFIKDGETRVIGSQIRFACWCASLCAKLPLDQIEPLPLIFAA